jgi:hypothetical protein
MHALTTREACTVLPLGRKYERTGLGSGNCLNTVPEQRLDETIGAVLPLRETYLAEEGVQDQDTELEDQTAVCGGYSDPSGMLFAACVSHLPSFSLVDATRRLLLGSRILSSAKLYCLNISTSYCPRRFGGWDSDLDPGSVLFAIAACGLGLRPRFARRRALRASSRFSYS